MPILLLKAASRWLALAACVLVFSVSPVAAQAKLPKKESAPITAPPLDEAAAKASEARKTANVSGPGPHSVGGLYESKVGSTTTVCYTFGTENGQFSILPGDKKVRPAYSFQAHTGRVNAVLIIGSEAYSGALDGKIKVWAVSSCIDWVRACDKAGRDWDKVAIPQPKAVWGDHVGGVLAIVEEPETKRIVTSGQDGTVRAWDSKTGKVVQTICKGRGPIPSISYRADGKAIAVLTQKQVFIHEVPKAAVFKAFNHNLTPARALSFSPDGKVVAVGGGTDGKPGEIVALEPEKGAKQFEFKGHLDAVYGVAFHPTLPRLASVSRDQSVRIWDVQIQKELYTERHVEPLVHVMYSVDGKGLASTSGKLVQFWQGSAEPSKKP